MPTKISISVSASIARRTKKLARERGFNSISAYLRHLIQVDGCPIITAETLFRRHKDTAKLAKQGKLIHAESLADFIL